MPSHLDHSPFLATLPSSLAIDPPLAFNCLVLGDDSSHLFPVKIEATESVGALKQEIWKEKQDAFKGADADKLIIWKVSILANSSLRQIFQNLKLIDEESLQLSAAKLSDVFPDLNEEHLHVVIRPPLSACTRLALIPHSDVLTVHHAVLSSSVTLALYY